jgi:hypothetical protein
MLEGSKSLSSSTRSDELGGGGIETKFRQSVVATPFAPT